MALGFHVKLMPRQHHLISYELSEVVPANSRKKKYFFGLDADRIRNMFKHMYFWTHVPQAPALACRKHSTRRIGLLSFS